MAELYKNKYRIESTRLKKWDYASPGAYFVTICTKNREPYFGKIVNGKMELSEMGQIAEKYWREIPVHFPHVQLDEFVVMPDHFHGIIIIAETPNVETPNLGVSTPRATTNLGVSTTTTPPMRRQTGRPRRRRVGAGAGNRRAGVSAAAGRLTDGEIAPD